jgi:predicted RNA-binding protein with PIN domain
MMYNRLIIDGYNLLHKDPILSELIRSDQQSARHRLVRMVEPTALRMARLTTIVFDGREFGEDPALTSKQLEVFFSPSNLSADSVIERIVCRCESPEKVLVVTSDRAEQETVLSAGAQTMSATEFLDRCNRTTPPSAPRTPPGKTPRLGDIFPEGL